MSFHQWLAKNEEARDTVRVMLNTQPDGKNWRGLIATPPGSPLETILSAFKKETNIPLEIPFFAFIHFVSGILLDKGTTIEGPIGTIYPELWTIVLAPSGSGKTFAHGVIEDNAPVKSTFPEPASGARFLEALSEQSPALWFQDEIAQKLKQIESIGTPLSDCKEYLLRAYDNKKIERSTKVSTITVEKPVLGILGLNTPESFKKALSAESLLDGFAQRFGFVWAEKDPERRMIDYPIYDRQRLDKACANAFAKLSETPIHATYRMNSEAKSAYDAAFTLLGKDHEGNESFYRRAMFRAFKYAAIYHVILGKENNMIDAADIGWGARLTHLHIQDMAKVLRKDDAAYGQFEELVAKAQKVKLKLAEEGKAITARAIQQGVRGIKSIDEAKMVLDML